VFGHKLTYFVRGR